MATVKKSASARQFVDDNQIITLYINSVLENNEPPKNIYLFCKQNNIDETEFYNFFGSFDAVTADGRAFTTSFHEGAFKGLGAVDHYMRVENLRAPSSVVLDQ